MITIEHSHAEGTVVHGTARGDGTNHVITATKDGWRFSRNIGVDGAWYLPCSRDRHPDTGKMDRLAAALRAAGYPVEVRVDDTGRSTAEIEAEREERAAGRAGRYRQLAETNLRRGTTALQAVDEARARIPLGQPVMGPRDANYRRKLHRREDAARDQIRTGQHWQRRAQAAETNLRYRHNPRVTVRRIEGLEAEQRAWQRQLDEVRCGGRHGAYADGGAHAHTAADYIARAERAIARLDQQITFWRSQLAALEAAGVWAPWRPEHFRPGDHALILGSWYPVVRVNRKSLTVPPLIFHGQRRFTDNGRDAWTDTVPYHKVYGRRRDGHTLHSPPPSPQATCTERVTVLTLDPKFIPETDAGPCTLAPVARLTIHHDGTPCGCDGRCLHDDTTGTVLAPWTEVRLWCDNHLAEYQATDPELLHQPPTQVLEYLPPSGQPGGSSS